MRLTKSFVLTLSAIVLATSLAGCSGHQRTLRSLAYTSEPIHLLQTSCESQMDVDGSEPSPTASSESVLHFGQPVAITSVGQSTDARMVRILCSRAGLEHVLDMTMVPARLTAETKTLVMVLGGGPKCLEAFNTAVANEIARARGLILKARRLSIPVVAMHIGGHIRRGDCSDRIIRSVGPMVDHLIVVAEGNDDDLFTEIACNEGIPLDLVADIDDSIRPLDELVRPGPSTIPNEPAGNVPDIDGVPTEG